MTLSARQGGCEAKFQQLSMAAELKRQGRAILGLAISRLALPFEGKCCSGQLPTRMLGSQLNGRILLFDLLIDLRKGLWIEILPVDHLRREETLLASPSVFLPIISSTHFSYGPIKWCAFAYSRRTCHERIPPPWSLSSSFDVQLCLQQNEIPAWRRMHMLAMFQIGVWSHQIIV